MLAPGTLLLERYLVERRIDAGGHSVVYRAQDQRLHRPVCIKVFHWLERGSPIYKATYHKFILEAQALSRLQHPNTLRLYDFGYLTGPGDELGAPFQVSEFMDAGSVYQRVRSKGPMPQEEVLSLVQNICAALDEAHEAGIVHRDIKPKNILLTMAGSRSIPKLADFGIAKTEDWGDDTAIIAGMPMLLFSPLWAAPEQLRSSPISPAADVYGMALVAVFLLTGRFVFRERKPAPAREERTRAHQLVAEAFRGCAVPDGLVDVLQTACELEPTKRYAKATDFSAALGEVLGGEQAASTYTPPPSGPLRPRRVMPNVEGQVVAGAPLDFASSATGPVHLDVGTAKVAVQHIARGAHEFVVTVQGTNCFVAAKGGRPTSAIQLTAGAEVELMAPSREVLGQIRIDFGRSVSGHQVFEIGQEAIAVAVEDAKDAVVVHIGDNDGYVIVGRA